MQFNPAENAGLSSFKFYPDYFALPFSTTQSPAMGEPQLNMSNVPVQNNYNDFLTNTPPIANHPKFLTHTPSIANRPKKGIFDNISETWKVSVRHSSDTSEMSSIPKNGTLAHSNEMKCTTRSAEIPVKFL